MERRQSKRLVKLEKTKTIAKENKTSIPKLSHNYFKVQKQINSIHTKNRKIQEWNLHHFVNTLITYMKEKNITLLKMEKLDVKSMTSIKQDIKKVTKGLTKKQNKVMRKNIIQISFSKLQSILHYKCVQYGIVVEYVEAKNMKKVENKCQNIYVLTPFSYGTFK